MKNSPSFFIFALIIILLSGLGTTAVFADEGAKFSLQMISSEDTPPTQSYYILQGQSGIKLENSIRVVNTGTVTGMVRLYPVDTMTAQTGGTVFRLQDDPLVKAGSWITLAVDELTLTAGESRDVPFSVTIPADVRAGHHVGGIIAETIEQKEVANENDNAGSSTFQVIVQSRSAVAVQVNLPGTAVEQIDVLGITAGGQGGHQTVAIGMSNSGTMMLKPTGSLIITNEAGIQVQNLEFSMDTFLPETAIEYPLFIENEALAAGDYLADLTLQYGENAESTQQFNFTVTNKQVAQTFGGRDELDAPAFATSNTTGGGGTPWPDMNLGSLLAFIVAVVSSVIVGIFIYPRRKQIVLTMTMVLFAIGIFFHPRRKQKSVSR